VASWNELLSQFMTKGTPEAKGAWIENELTNALEQISGLRGGTHVLAYSSAFLQKPRAPAEQLMITMEEINGLMSVLHGMDWGRGLTLILHTPGGQTTATQSFVDYLHSKFERIEAIVPTYAMSAGTMISLATDHIVMGRHSQLGPIDPQMPFGGRTVSAQAVVDQFARARQEIVGTSAEPGDTAAAHLWAPVLQSLGPSVLQEAQNAIDYSEQLVAAWLSEHMFRNEKTGLKWGGQQHTTSTTPQNTRLMAEGSMAPKRVHTTFTWKTSRTTQTFKRQCSPPTIYQRS
jgi:hypothetical protein